WSSCAGGLSSLLGKNLHRAESEPHRHASEDREAGSERGEKMLPRGEERFQDGDGQKVQGGRCHAGPESPLLPAPKRNRREQDEQRRGAGVGEASGPEARSHSGPGIRPGTQQREGREEESDVRHSQDSRAEPERFHGFRGGGGLTIAATGIDRAP